MSHTQYTKMNPNSCIVCDEKATYYSVGMCEHPVCFECSARIRVLCQQTECPICRQDMPKVVFTKQIKPFRFYKKLDIFNEKYKIYFEDNYIREKFEDLLSYYCTVCRNSQYFNSFDKLKEHMHRRHDLYYCDLCVNNLTRFPCEKRTYSKAELDRHLSKGDKDDKSQKGHPLCEFCGQRYMDNDDLYRHLRRAHLYCHFCDADGLHHYYQTYDYLRNHYRQEHFLCEEGPCAEEQFTSVFRTDIDLKAHKTSVHGKFLGKAAAKQARTLEVEFTLAPRSDGRNRRMQGHENNFPNGSRYQEPESDTVPAEFIGQRPIDFQSREEFPTLGNSNTIPMLTPSLSRKGNRLRIHGRLSQGNYNQNFPALSAESSSNSLSTATAPSSIKNPMSKTVKLNVSVSRPNCTVTTHVSGSNIRIRPGTSRDADFPALDPQSSNITTATPSPQTWTKVTCAKELPKAKKVAPLPLSQAAPPIRSSGDFPSLGGGTSQVAPASWVQVKSKNTGNSLPDATKGKAKKKKKQQHQNLVPATTNNNEATSPKSNKSQTPNNSNKKTKAPETSKVINEQREQSTSINTGETQNSSQKERKKTELRIDNLNITNDNNSCSAVTPKHKRVINELSSSMPVQKSPLGKLSPPPGFTAPVIPTPPPGFCDLTFTNSSGETYNIPDIDFNSKATFIPPPDCQKRNQQLIEEFNKYLNSQQQDSEELKAFRFISQLFKNGQCDADKYYNQCQVVMGTEVFERIFPELLVLLPDINKQRELLVAHNRVDKSSKIEELEECFICGQILRSQDLMAHKASHDLENHFPALGNFNK